MALDFDGVGEEVLTEDLDGAGGGREEAGEHLDGGGFAGAVGSEEAEELAGLDVEIDVVDCGEAIEDAGKGVGGDCWGHDCRVYDNRKWKAMNRSCRKRILKDRGQIYAGTTDRWVAPCDCDSF